MQALRKGKLLPFSTLHLKSLFMFCNLAAQLVTCSDWILKSEEGVPDLTASGACARKQVLGKDLRLFTRLFEERKNWLTWMSKSSLLAQRISSGNLFLKKLDG